MLPNLKTLPRLILANSLLVAASSNLLAESQFLYVAPNGDDFQNDGSLYQPYASLKRCFDYIDTIDGRGHTPEHKWTIYLKGGTYTPDNFPDLADRLPGFRHESYYPRIAFFIHNYLRTPTTPITIRAYPGHVPVFDFINDPNIAYGILISDCDHIALKSVIFTNIASDTGIGGSQYSPTGIFLSNSSNIVVDGCKILNLSVINESGYGGSGIGMKNGTTNCTIRNCHVENIFDDAHTTHVHGIYNGGVERHDNRVHGNFCNSYPRNDWTAGGVGLVENGYASYSSHALASRVFNNFVYKNYMAGIEYQWTDGIQIHQNLVWGTGNSGYPNIWDHGGNINAQVYSNIADDISPWHAMQRIRLFAFTEDYFYAVYDAGTYDILYKFAYAVQGDRRIIRGCVGYQTFRQVHAVAANEQSVYVCCDGVDYPGQYIVVRYPNAGPKGNYMYRVKNMGNGVEPYYPGDWDGVEWLGYQQLDHFFRMAATEHNGIWVYKYWYQTGYPVLIKYPNGETGANMFAVGLDGIADYPGYTHDWLGYQMFDDWFLRFLPYGDHYIWVAKWYGGQTMLIKYPIGETGANMFAVLHDGLSDYPGYTHDWIGYQHFDNFRDFQIAGDPADPAQQSVWVWLRYGVWGEGYDWLIKYPATAYGQVMFGTAANGLDDYVNPPNIHDEARWTGNQKLHKVHSFQAGTEFCWVHMMSLGYDRLIKYPAWGTGSNIFGVDYNGLADYPGYPGSAAWIGEQRISDVYTWRVHNGQLLVSKENIPTIANFSESLGSFNSNNFLNTDADGIGGYIYPSGQHIAPKWSCLYNPIYLENTENTEEGTSTNVAFNVGGNMINVEFAYVAGDGVTTVVEEDAGPPLPEGFERFGGRDYNISTSADFQGKCLLTLIYDPYKLPGGALEPSLTLFHYEDGAWVDITVPGYPDTTYNTIMGEVDFLSRFALAFQADSDGDGVLDPDDNCELPNPDQGDCQPNGVGDVCDMAGGTSQDCQPNEVPDECDIAAGTSQDADANGVPDECQELFFVDADAPAAGDGSSWALAFNYLQDALAVAGGAGDEIRVAQGTYRPDEDATNPNGTGDPSATFQLISGVEIYGGYAGYGEPDERDIALHDTILSGDLDENDGPAPFQNNALNSYHVTTGSGTDETALLDGFTISGGNARAPESVGGGMRNNAGSPTISNCTLRGNWASSGAGMRNDASSPTLANCAFSGNHADWAGGGMDNDHSSNPTLTNCTFSGHSGSVYGGGMVNQTSSHPTLINCTFSGNHADWGGGMYNTVNCSPTLTNCSFIGNSAPTYQGGGVYNGLDSDPTLINCIFSGNNADSGGGMWSSSNSNATLHNCTFSQNHASNSGGAIYGTSGSDDSSSTLVNCILWNDSADAGANEISGAAIATYSDIEGGWAGQGNMNADPQFMDADGPDDIPGTEDDDLRVVVGSPCTDAGNNTAVPPDAADLDDDGDTGERTPLDLGGNPRFVDDPLGEDAGLPNPPDYPEIVDIGAYEFQGSLSDCNGNGVPDDQDIAAGTSADCNSNSVPDECDIAGGTSADCNANSVSDECEPNEDCNANSVQDICDIAAGTSQDCQPNWIPDECDLTQATSSDVNDNGLPDDCEDCNGNGLPDECDLDCAAASGDCNVEGCGQSEDCNADGVADDCQFIYVDADAPAGGDGSSWTLAFQYLRNALNAAQCGDTIRVAEGTYRPDEHSTWPPGGLGNQYVYFWLINGVAIEGGYAGLGRPDPNQRDFVTFETILSGDLAENDGPGFVNTGENSFRVVVGSYRDETAILDGVTVTGGNARVSGYHYGGGMYNYRGSPTLRNCTFRANSAIYYGGGMANEYCSPTLINCVFVGNRAVRRYGGGIWNYYYSSPTLTGCVFSGNSAYQGGGIWNDYYSSPTLTGCVFSGNSADNAGGGIYNYLSHPTLTQCSFEANTAGNQGGGIYNNASNPNLNECLISGSWAAVGGGVYNYYSSPTVTDCVFQDNWASISGGGIYVNVGNPTLENCMLLENVAFANGGGVYDIGSNVTLDNCTLNDNVAFLDGGGIYGGESLTDCTLSRNWADFNGGGSFGTPTLTRCTFHDNWANGDGGAADDANTIIASKFIENTALGSGGGVNNYDQSPTIINCLFSGNIAYFGGGICNSSGGTSIIPAITNCTFTANSAFEGGGIYSAVLGASENRPNVTNSILWDNSDDSGVLDTSQIRDGGGAQSIVNMSCIQGLSEGFGGSGNIGDNPLCIDMIGPDGIPGSLDDDLRLAVGSPCIDAGTNLMLSDVDDDLFGAPRFAEDPDTPDTGIGLAPIVDMGAYEYRLSGDFDGTGSLDLGDFAILALCIGRNAPNAACQAADFDCADFDGNGAVDLVDFAAFAMRFGT